jgi:pyruvate, orthophosphate dikinase
MSAQEQISITRLGRLGLPVPASVRIDVGTDDADLRRAVIAALATLSGPSRRIGSPSDPLLLAVAAQAEPPNGSTTFLGATADSLAWLDARGGGALAAAIRQRDFSGGTAPEPVDQIIRVARSLCTPSVTLYPMMLGCRRDGDGAGLVRSRDPDTGRARLSGFFRPGSCGILREDDPAAAPLNDFTDRPWWTPLTRAVRSLEAQQRDGIELEFVVQDGQLCVVGAAAAPGGAAACVITAALLDEGVVDAGEAVERVTPQQFADAIRPAGSGLTRDSAVGHGLGVSPGTACGHATFDPARAIERAERGQPVVLIRTESRPEDLNALLAAAAVVTIRGGRTSHAAVIARTIGRPCVVGLVDARLDPGRAELHLGFVTIAEGDVITVDGDRGLLALGASADPTPVGGTASNPAAQRLLKAADAYRRLEVWANADRAHDATLARRAGATGIGLCRTEHMFLGDRHELLAEVLLRPNDRTAQESLDDLHRLQCEDFRDILAAMDGLPVTIRLLDPPRHEFLPDLTELSVQAAVAADRGAPDAVAERRLHAVRQLSERNPMLGVRGIRLGLLLPWLYEMQVTALVEATMARLRAGADPRPSLLVPMVASAAELRPVRAFTEHVLEEARSLADREMTLPIGVMIETPRAALVAGELAGVADFFSIGTNDLTQLTWGLSRDDTDSTVLRRYQSLGLIDASPFERLDRTGVGQLIEFAVRAGRAARADLRIGVCGEHAADPESIQAFHDWGLDYVSCPPPELTRARYAAGRAGRIPLESFSTGVAA